MRGEDTKNKNNKVIKIFSISSSKNQLGGAGAETDKRKNKYRKVKARTKSRDKEAEIIREAIGEWERTVRPISISHSFIYYYNIKNNN